MCVNARIKTNTSYRPEHQAVLRGQAQPPGRVLHDGQPGRAQPPQARSCMQARGFPRLSKNERERGGQQELGVGCAQGRERRTGRLVGHSKERLVCSRGKEGGDRDSRHKNRARTLVGRLFIFLLGNDAPPALVVFFIYLKGPRPPRPPGRTAPSWARRSGTGSPRPSSRTLPTATLFFSAPLPRWSSSARSELLLLWWRWRWRWRWPWRL